MTGKTLTDAFSLLSEGLYRIAYYILEDEADAQDTVQDLFVKLWTQRDSLDTVVSLKAYCISLTRNMCIDRMRRSAKVCHEQEISMTEEQRSADQDFDAREKLARVISAIERLPARQRDVMKMYVLQEMSYEEISRKTGISNLSLRVLLSNARKSLRTEFNEIN